MDESSQTQPGHPTGDGDGKPADGDGKPGEGERKSADVDNKSADRDGKSADVDNKSADRDGEAADVDSKSADRDGEAGEGERTPGDGGRKKPNRTTLTMVLAVLILLTIGNYVSTAIIATLIKHHPAWLIGLNPTTRNLILVASEMPAPLYFALAIVRRMLPHPLWYLLGRWYGDAGIRWVQRHSPDIGAMVTTLEQYFPRYGWLICILYPAPLVCTMAGASTMSFGAFAFFTVVGVVAFTVTARAGSDLLHPVTSAVANFSARYWIPLTVLSVAIVVIGLVAGQMGGRSKIESISSIEAELDGGWQDGVTRRADNDPPSE